MDDVTSNKYYLEGKLYFRKYQDSYSNPYVAGTSEHDLFERGYTQALKRSSDIGAELASKLGYKRKQSNSNVKRQATKNEYLRRKG